jgi:hypothetical protein
MFDWDFCGGSHSKSTEEVSWVELELLMHFISVELNCPSTAHRQKLASALKTVLTRLNLSFIS